MGLPDWDEEHAKYAHDLLFSSDALLLGRRTYEEEVARLKEQPGQHILKYGSGDLDRTLIQNNLIDEFHFWLFPLTIGGGLHLFDGIDGSLKLVRTTTLSSGIVILTYGPELNQETGERPKSDELSSAGSTTLGRVNPPPSRAWDGVTGDS